jgi:hypothetical protein
MQWAPVIPAVPGMVLRTGIELPAAPGFFQSEADMDTCQYV